MDLASPAVSGTSVYANGLIKPFYKNHGIALSKLCTVSELSLRAAMRFRCHCPTSMDNHCKILVILGTEVQLAAQAITYSICVAEL